MKHNDDPLSQEIGQAIERAFGKLDGLFSELVGEADVCDEVQVVNSVQVSVAAPPAGCIGDDEGVDEIQVVNDVKITDVAPPTGRIIAVGPTGEWWPEPLRRIRPGEAVILASVASVWLAVGLRGVPVPFRVIVTFWFLLACPGFAALRLLQLRNPAILATLSVAASIGIDTVLAEAMLYTHTWSPGAAVAGLAGFSLAALTAGRLYGGRVAHALS